MHPRFRSVLHSFLFYFSSDAKVEYVRVKIWYYIPRSQGFHNFDLGVTLGHPSQSWSRASTEKGFDPQISIILHQLWTFGMDCVISRDRPLCYCLSKNGWLTRLWLRSGHPSTCARGLGYTNHSANQVIGWMGCLRAPLIATEGRGRTLVSHYDHLSTVQGFLR